MKKCNPRVSLIVERLRSMSSCTVELDPFDTCTSTRSRAEPRLTLTARRLEPRTNVHSLSGVVELVIIATNIDRPKPTVEVAKKSILHGELRTTSAWLPPNVVTLPPGGIGTVRDVVCSSMKRVPPITRSKAEK
ncbi:MAG: hypothetical protein IV100_28900 [Myxococcales bacterium]|nr:hypothetical protein [Myxococcales bacterium]